MKKYYVLPMFPYPSGFAMHVGHASNFLITEFVARVKRMQGYDVVFPIGYDSFGLPTENFAIKNNKSARQATEDNVKYFEEQIKAMDFSFDDDRRFKTSDPQYYKWTQWIFKKLFDHGLVYKKDGLVNRCPGCQTVLANDQVVDGKCERCESIIIQKKHPQRYIAITQYADKLIADLDLVDRPEETKVTQKNWIGKSMGAEVDFEIVGQNNPQKTDKKYIICDFDGVIADSFESIAKAFSQIGHIPSLGKTFTFDDAEQYIKEYARKKPNHAKDTIFTNEELQELQEDFKKVGKLVHELGISLHREFIDTLKSMRAEVAVVSSGSEEYIQPAIIKSGLESTHVLCYEDHHSKEEKVLHICKDWGADPKDVYYITDSLADVYELQDFLGNNKIIGVTRGQCNRQELETKLASTCVIDEQQDIAKCFSADISSKITVFTTRPDTLYGVTAVVLAPENDILDTLLAADKKQELSAYRAEVSKMNAIDRQSTERPKTGFDSGVCVRHPLTDDLVPVRYADYVLMDYATGAVMFVPAHDERDRAFAQQYAIPTKTVIVSADANDTLCYTGLGVLTNSAQFNGLDNIEAKIKITEHLESIGKGKKKTTFRLRDRSVSRQRYRGSPIPVYYTFADNEDGRYTPDNPHPDKSKWIPHAIPQDELPVVLPLDLPNYKPAGKSPLEDHPSFKYYHAKDGNVYLRECDTLDTFMCSSFYYLRFLDPHNSDYLISPEKAQYMPVDLYVGGKEHSVGHLIYARFIHKFLKDIGEVKTDSPEPFAKLIHQGMIQGPDGRKMSKRRGNIVDPLDVIKQYDADTLRTYIAFMGPIELQKNWNPEAVGGTNRFLKRFGKLVDMVTAESVSTDLISLIHQTVKGVTEDVDNLKFNTAISKMMIATNAVYDAGHVTADVLTTLVLLLAPFAPQLCQTMRQALGHKGEVAGQARPSYDATLAVSETMELPIQFNGKTKGSLMVPRGIDQNQVLELVHRDPKLGKYVTGLIKKVIR
ncbi:MAG: class I tRNA ligase family protein, partial [Candidatus Absconditabacterales bacterium]